MITRKQWPSRFWNKAIITGADDCWEWMAAKYAKGYGQIRIDGKTQRAHRVAWELTHGKIPDDMLVMHTCDNPSCINPRHLRLGTPQDNSTDMVTKGRSASGEEDGNSKLVAREVQSIKTDGRGARELSQIHGVSTVCIYDILKGRTWRSVVPTQSAG